MNEFILALTLICLTGIAVAADPEQQESPAPVTQELGTAQPESARQDAAARDSCVVFIIRPPYWANAIRGLTVSIDNAEIASLSNSSYTAISTRQKQLHIVGEGGFLSWDRKEDYFYMDAGKTYFLAWLAEEHFGMMDFTDSKGLPILGPKMDPKSVHWQLVDFDTAQELLKKASYVPAHFQEAQ